MSIEKQEDGQVVKCDECGRETKFSLDAPLDELVCIYCAGEVPDMDDPDLQKKDE